MAIGRKGIGSRKHGRSGRGHNLANAIKTSRERNKEIAEKTEFRKRKKPKMVEDIKKLFTSK